MRNTKWLVMAGILSFAGVAAAGDDKWKDRQDLTEVEVDEGDEIRTGYQQDDEEIREEGREVKEEAKDVADAVGDKAERGVDKAGSGLAEAIREGSDSVQGVRRTERGMLNDGDFVHNTLTTDPVGMVLGDGINLQYSRPLSDKFSVVGGAQFSRTRAADGSVTSIGVAGGADYFIMGQRNEGLRIGPRLELGMGGETLDDNSVFGALGAAGELGYNWIANNGITAGAGLGVRARMGGTTENDLGDNRIGVVAPYGKLNLGYSW